ncbi:hypothetical protein BGZ68_003469 [Mortierella alpina]|nr:hypothetical protein BGZ68_003469 [Mortierella alpina]
MPHCIKHFPGVVLDVVLSATAKHPHVDPNSSWSLAPAEAPSRAATDDLTDLYSPDANGSTKGFDMSAVMTTAESVTSLAIAVEPSTGLSPAEPLQSNLKRRSTTSIQSEMKTFSNAMTERMIALNRAGKPLDGAALRAVIEDSLPPEYHESVVNLMTVFGELKAIHEQGRITQQIVRQVLAEAQQIKDRLILIERKTAAILTQNYELLEYTIPRLFIVLPEPSSKWDPKNVLRTKFRLHFICECGEHTKPAIGNNKMPHHLHLADHEGYVIREPTEFFKKYGPFMMLMLEMIKFGTGVAGHVVPALASLKVVDIVDSVQSTLNKVTSDVIAGVDCSLAYLEKNRALGQESGGVIADGNAGASQQDLANYLADVEGLEGVDLRQLGSYLTTNSSDNLLGNLFRMTTKEGHVKWVCREHYRAGLQEERIQKLRDIVKLSEGEFDEQLGKIKIKLSSSFAAAELYDAICKAKCVLDLDISLKWDQDFVDYVKIKDMLMKSNIKSLKSFEVEDVPREFFRLSNPLPKKADFSHLRHLRIGVPWTADTSSNEWDEDIDKLRAIVSKATNLTSLLLDTQTEKLPAVYSAIAQCQTYPVEFIDQGFSLRILPASTKLRPSKTVFQDLRHLFKVHGGQVEKLYMHASKLADSAMEALAEATHNGSRLKELALGRVKQNVGDKFITDFAKVVARSKLCKLRIALETEVARVRILDPAINIATYTSSGNGMTVEERVALATNDQPTTSVVIGTTTIPTGKGILDIPVFQDRE